MVKILSFSWNIKIYIYTLQLLIVEILMSTVTNQTAVPEWGVALAMTSQFRLTWKPLRSHREQHSLPVCALMHVSNGFLSLRSCDDIMTYLYVPAVSRWTGASLSSMTVCGVCGLVQVWWQLKFGDTSCTSVLTDGCDRRPRLVRLAPPLRLHTCLSHNPLLPLQWYHRFH